MKILAALVGLILALGVALGQHFPWWWPGQAQGIVPTRAQTFVENQGVIIHPLLPNDQMISALRYTGVRNLRQEWYTNMIGAGLAYRWSDFVQAGFNIDLLMTPAQFNCDKASAAAFMQTNIASAKALDAVNPGHVKWFEGLNEINNFGACWQDSATAAGSSGNTITFAPGLLPAAVPAIVDAGYGMGIVVSDTTTSSHIPANSVVAAATPTSVTLNNPVAVAIGDVVQFRADTGYPHTATASGSSGAVVTFAAGQIPFWLERNIATGFGKLTVVTDVTTPSAIPSSTTVSGGTETSLTLSHPVNVLPNDVLNFNVTVAYPIHSAGAIGWQATMYNAVKADPILAGGDVWGYSDCCAPGPPTGTADQNNVHFYPHFSAQPLSQLDEFYREAFTPGLGTMVDSEGNYCATGGGQDCTDRAHQAILSLNTLFDVNNNKNWTGQINTYELVDEGDGLGWFDVAGNPYPIARAYHNLNSIVTDIGATALSFTPTPVRYHVTGLPPPVQTGVIQTTNYGGQQKIWQKANGNNYVALWNEPQIWDYHTSTGVVAPTTNVTVAFDNSYLFINVYDPIIQETPISTASNANQVTVGLSADPLIVETVTVHGLVPVVTAPLQTPAAPVGLAIASPGLLLTEFQNQPGETFTVSLQAAGATTLAATGSGVSGSGTANLTIAGNSLAATNTILGTVKVTSATNDTIAINVQDSYGNVGKLVGQDIYGHTIRVPSINSVVTKPVIAGPTPVTVVTSAKTGIPGISVSEPGYQGETYSGTVGTSAGLLNATGSGVAGNGTATLTLTGLTQAQLNAVLGSLEITAAVAATITLNVTNAFTLSANPVTVGINTTAAPTLNSVAARQAQPFIDGMGFVIHTEPGYPTYQDMSIVIAGMNYFGLTAIRDFAPYPWESPTRLAHLEQLGAAGMKFMWNIGTGFNNPTCTPTNCLNLDSVYTAIAGFESRHPGSVIATEGPNEINNSPLVTSNLGITNAAATTTTTTGDTLHFPASTAKGAVQKQLLAVFHNPSSSVGNFQNQVFVSDETNPSAIPSGTYVTSTAADATTVTLNHGTTVGSGDIIQFYVAFNEAAGLFFMQFVYDWSIADPVVGGLPIVDFTKGTNTAYPPQFQVSNWHIYGGFGLTFANPFNRTDVGWIIMMNEQHVKPGAPFWATELGQAHGNGCFEFCVDLTTYASILLNNILDAQFQDQFSAPGGLTPVPAQRQFIYELLDEQCATGYDFGVLDCHGTPHLGGIALKNLLTILRDPGGSFTPTAFSFGFKGGFPPDAYHNGTYARLMQKRGGAFEIILQTDQSTYNTGSATFTGCNPYSVQVGFAAAPTTVNVYDPMVAATPINSYSSPAAVAVVSCKDPLIIEVIGAGALVASGYTATGPTTGTTGTPSSNFTVNATGGAFTGSQTITIADGSGGGVFTPSVGSPGTSTVTVTPTAGSSSFTFTYNAASNGAHVLTFTNGQAWTNAGPRTYTSSPVPATGYTATGPASGTTGAPSTNFTVNATGGAFTGLQTITIGDGSGGGVFTPSVGAPGTSTVTVTPPAATSSFTFTYNAVSSGAHALTFTNGQAWSNAGPLTYTTSPAGATGYTAAGPTTGTTGTISTNFTVTATGGTFNGLQTVTIADGSGGGTFTPSVGSPGTSTVTVTPPVGAANFTFTYNAVSNGAHVLTFTNGQGWTNPGALTYTTAPVGATGYTAAGPAAGATGFPSTNFTVTATGGTFNGLQTVTIADGSAGGVFTPSVGAPGTSIVTVTPAAGVNSFTFTYNAATSGAHTLTFSNGQAWGDSGPLTYTSSPAATGYTATGPTTGLTGAPSTNFTVTATAGTVFTGAQTVTIADGSGGGVFTPSVGAPGTSTVTVTPPAGGNSFTFTYNAASNGAHVLTFTNGQAWTNAGPLTYSTAPGCIPGSLKFNGNCTTVWMANGVISP